MPTKPKKKKPAPAPPPDPGGPPVPTTAPDGRPLPNGIPPGYAKKLGGNNGHGWLPGQSGNPSGLAKHPKPSITGVLRSLLAEEQEYEDPKSKQRVIITVAERVARRLLAMALDKGATNKERSLSLTAIGVILDRSEGKAPQTVRHSLAEKEVGDLDESELAEFMGRVVETARAAAASAD